MATKYGTPLRYPGGKGKLASYVQRVIEDNDLEGGTYVEPFAGGSAIACQLLLSDLVSKIHINDISRPVWAFWWSVLHATDQLMQRIRDVKVTVSNWDRQKKIFIHHRDHEIFEVGFAAFFLNRTNRSGIFNGGIIGGREQEGEWKIGARFYKKTLIERVRAIAEKKDQITLTRRDAASLLKSGFVDWPSKTLIYLDPPYFVKGKALYLDFYQHDNHKEIADLLIEKKHKQRWIVSYDNVDEIRAMYKGQRRRQYELLYTAREVRKGAEVMFFSHGLNIPKME